MVAIVTAASVKVNVNVEKCIVFAKAIVLDRYQTTALAPLYM